MPNKNLLQSPITDMAMIQQMLPHREPMLLVDTLSYVDNRKAVAHLTILASNIFVDSEQLSETGLIEHMAQSSALYIGHEHIVQNLPIKEGFIAMIKNLRIDRLPKIKETVDTEAQIDYEIGDMKVVNITTTINNNIIATAEMTLVLKEKS
ncbi:MAG TPA: hypothetical protein VKZ98_09620 [Aquaticitalea sp.]|nr:hypothetical protein [Aquaticitalea sp.]